MMLKWIIASIWIPACNYNSCVLKLLAVLLNSILNLAVFCSVAVFQLNSEISASLFPGKTYQFNRQCTCYDHFIHITCSLWDRIESAIWCFPKTRYSCLSSCLCEPCSTTARTSPENFSAEIIRCNVPPCRAGISVPL
jgi:hypothetical protein